jgi:hypothetical protein
MVDLDPIVWVVLANEDRACDRVRQRTCAGSPCLQGLLDGDGVAGRNCTHQRAIDLSAELFDVVVVEDVEKRPCAKSAARRSGRGRESALSSMR